MEIPQCWPMFADVKNVRDVISAPGNYNNCQRQFKSIWREKNLIVFDPLRSKFFKRALRRQQRVCLPIYFTFYRIFCNQIITENCNHPTRGHWMKWSSIGWHSESVGGGQHGGWGCDVWRARFFQMFYVWQPALYCEKGEKRHFEFETKYIAAVRRWGKARRFIFSIWAIEILTFKGHQTIYLPKRRTVFKWRVKVVNN